MKRIFKTLLAIVIFFPLPVQAKDNFRYSILCNRSMEFLSLQISDAIIFDITDVSGTELDGKWLTFETPRRENSHSRFSYRFEAKDAQNKANIAKTLNQKFKLEFAYYYKVGSSLAPALREYLIFSHEDSVEIAKNSSFLSIFPDSKLIQNRNKYKLINLYKPDLYNNRGHCAYLEER